MAVDHRDMIAFQEELERTLASVPDIMDKLAVGEGRYARDQARKICKEENIVNTNSYRENFKCGTKAIRNGDLYTIDVFNNLDYAKHLEYGFRGHYVPPEYLSGHYRDEYPNGLYVHFQLGHHTLKRAKGKTLRTQETRLARKYLEELRKRKLDKFIK